MRQILSFYPRFLQFMTTKILYTFPMKTLSYLLALSLPIKGLLFFVLLFALCLIGVHILQLAKLGWFTLHNEKLPPKPTPPPPKQEKQAPAKPPQEPVYYIVERKTRRPKTSYGEPKQINFKP